MGKMMLPGDYSLPGSDTSLPPNEPSTEDGMVLPPTYNANSAPPAPSTVAQGTGMQDAPTTEPFLSDLGRSILSRVMGPDERKGEPVTNPNDFEHSLSDSAYDWAKTEFQSFKNIVDPFGEAMKDYAKMGKTPPQWLNDTVEEDKNLPSISDSEPHGTPSSWNKHAKTWEDKLQAVNLLANYSGLKGIVQGGFNSIPFLIPAILALNTAKQATGKKEEIDKALSGIANQLESGAQLRMQMGTNIDPMTDTQTQGVLNSAMKGDPSPATASIINDPDAPAYLKAAHEYAMMYLDPNNWILGGMMAGLHGHNLIKEKAPPDVGPKMVLPTDFINKEEAAKLLNVKPSEPEPEMVLPPKAGEAPPDYKPKVELSPEVMALPSDYTDKMPEIRPVDPASIGMTPKMNKALDEYNGKTRDNIEDLSNQRLNWNKEVIAHAGEQIPIDENKIPSSIDVNEYPDVIGYKNELKPVNGDPADNGITTKVTGSTNELIPAQGEGIPSSIDINKQNDLLDHSNELKPITGNEPVDPFVNGVKPNETKPRTTRLGAFGGVSPTEFQGFLDTTKEFSEGVKNALKGLLDSGKMDHDVMDSLYDIERTKNLEKSKPGNTTVKKVPTIFKLLKWNKDDTVYDNGMGAYDLGRDYVKLHGANHIGFDVFSRGGDFNAEEMMRLNKMREEGKSPNRGVVCDVLNTIPDQNIRESVLERSKNIVKPGGKIYVQCYNKEFKTEPKTYEDHLTTRGTYQWGKPIDFYLPEAEKVFGKENVKVIRFKGVKDGFLEITNPGPDKPTGGGGGKPIGKKVGQSSYVHKSALDQSILPKDEVNRAKNSLPSDFNYDIIKHNGENGNVSFIQSPDWDTATEPKVGDLYTVDREGNAKLRTASPNRVQIYHHKHQFVSPDYTGFNVDESKARSEYWKGMPWEKGESNKIGDKAYFDRRMNEFEAAKPQAPKTWRDGVKPNETKPRTTRLGFGPTISDSELQGAIDTASDIGEYIKKTIDEKMPWVKELGSTFKEIVDSAKEVIPTLNDKERTNFHEKTTGKVIDLLNGMAKKISENATHQTMSREVINSLKDTPEVPEHIADFLVKGDLKSAAEGIRLLPWSPVLSWELFDRLVNKDGWSPEQRYAWQGFYDLLNRIHGDILFGGRDLNAAMQNGKSMLFNDRGNKLYDDKMTDKMHQMMVDSGSKGENWNELKAKIDPKDAKMVELANKLHEFQKQRTEKFKTLENQWKVKLDYDPDKVYVHRIIDPDPNIWQVHTGKGTEVASVSNKDNSSKKGSLGMKIRDAVYLMNRKVNGIEDGSLFVDNKEGNNHVQEVIDKLHEKLGDFGKDVNKPKYYSDRFIMDNIDGEVTLSKKLKAQADYAVKRKAELEKKGEPVPKEIEDKIKERENAEKELKSHDQWGNTKLKEYLKEKGITDDRIKEEELMFKGKQKLQDVLDKNAADMLQHAQDLVKKDPTYGKPEGRNLLMKKYDALMKEHENILKGSEERQFTDKLKRESIEANQKKQWYESRGKDVPQKILDKLAEGEKAFLADKDARGKLEESITKATGEKFSLDDLKDDPLHNYVWRQRNESSSPLELTIGDKALSPEMKNLTGAYHAHKVAKNLYDAIGSEGEDIERGITHTNILQRTNDYINRTPGYSEMHDLAKDFANYVTGRQRFLNPVANGALRFFNGIQAYYKFGTVPSHYLIRLSEMSELMKKLWDTQDLKDKKIPPVIRDVIGLVRAMGRFSKAGAEYSVQHNKLMKRVVTDLFHADITNLMKIQDIMEKTGHLDNGNEYSAEFQTTGGRSTLGSIRGTRDPWYNKAYSAFHAIPDWAGKSVDNLSRSIISNAYFDLHPGELDTLFNAMKKTDGFNQSRLLEMQPYELDAFDRYHRFMDTIKANFGKDGQAMIAYHPIVNTAFFSFKRWPLQRMGERAQQVVDLIAPNKNPDNFSAVKGGDLVPSTLTQIAMGGVRATTIYHIIAGLHVAMLAYVTARNAIQSKIPYLKDSPQVKRDEQYIKDNQDWMAQKDLQMTRWRDRSPNEMSYAMNDVIWNGALNAMTGLDWSTRLQHKIDVATPGLTFFINSNNYIAGQKDAFKSEGDNALKEVWHQSVPLLSSHMLKAAVSMRNNLNSLHGSGKQNLTPYEKAKAFFSETMLNALGNNGLAVANEATRAGGGLHPNGTEDFYSAMKFIGMSDQASRESATQTNYDHLMKTLNKTVADKTKDLMATQWADIVHKYGQESPQASEWIKNSYTPLMLSTRNETGHEISMSGVNDRMLSMTDETMTWAKQHSNMNPNLKADREIVDAEVNHGKVEGMLLKASRQVANGVNVNHNMQMINYIREQLKSYGYKDYSNYISPKYINEFKNNLTAKR